MKSCGRCLQSKPESEFRAIKSKLHSYCAQCQVDYDRERYLNKRELRKKQIKENRERVTAQIRVLKDNPCMDCGNKFHFSAMQFDHRPGESKLEEVSNLARNGCLQMALKEIEKWT